MGVKEVEWEEQLPKLPQTREDRTVNNFKVRVEPNMSEFPLRTYVFWKYIFMHVEYVGEF